LEEVNKNARLWDIVGLTQSEEMHDMSVNLSKLELS